MHSKIYQNYIKKEVHNYLPTTPLRIMRNKKYMKNKKALFLKYYKLFKNVSIMNAKLFIYRKTKAFIISDNLKRI
jgi:hypothetical protein